MKSLIKLAVICYVLLFSESYSTPCSRYFQYKLEGDKWIGAMTIPSLPLGTNQSVSTYLTISAQPETQYYGHIEIVPSKREYIHDIVAGRPLRYKVRFPSTNSIPHLTKIDVNDETICSNLPAMGFSFTLQHTLYTQLAKYCFKNYVVLDEVWKCIIKWTPVDPVPNICTYLPETCKRLSIAEQETKAFPSIKPAIKTTSVTELHQHCGISNALPNHKGEIAEAGDWPWMAAIYILNNKEINFRCGGNLISHTFIITAAHCIYGKDQQIIPANQILLILGRYNLNDWNDEAIIPEVERIISHPEYRYRFISFDADIALLELKKEVQFNEHVRPLCLWKGPSDLELIVGMEAAVTGWGQDEIGQHANPVLRVANVLIVSNKTCASSSDEFMHITSNRTLCAGNRNGGGPCNGDSGGGLVMSQNGRWTLRGIVSRTLANPDSQCNFDKYVLYTDATKFHNWIMKYISE